MSLPNPGGRLRLDKAVCLRSGCKINVHLEITGFLPHGRHSIYTHMLPLDEPHDEILLRPLDAFEQGINPSDGPKCLTFFDQEGIDPLNNTMTVAHALLARKFPALPDIAVELHKEVPLGAGLGGGSANAAALLLFLNDFIQKHGYNDLPRHELLKIAAQVGADVPFFILNLPAEASGTGTTLKPNPAVSARFAGMHLVLICPGVHVSTAW
ncbi:MAG: hypothetical protein LBD82_02470, partial [Deltaproteobacteria bacterium]|nr:hypothetical protein [Deltaproteobacteria bacterium]